MVSLVRAARPKIRISFNLCSFFFLLLLTSVPSGAQVDPRPELVVATYDTLVAKGGMGPELFRRFEAQCNCRVRVLSSGDAGQLLSRLQLDAERGKPSSQVVLGIDEPLWQRAKKFLEQDWEPANVSALVPEVKAEKGFVPLDYGYYAFMADNKALSEAKLTAPSKFMDLLKPEWRRNLLLEDPRTSTPGLAFVLYANEVAANGPAQGTVWPKLRTQWLTLTPGWDQAYGLFLKGEAPVVWSYTTSQAYHEEHGDVAGPARRYQALVFDEGQPIQVEGAALVKGGSRTPEQQKLSRQFLEFLLTPDVQNLIPQKQWMYPVLKSAVLPLSFTNLPKPRKVVRLPSDPAKIAAALADWNRQVQGGR